MKEKSMFSRKFTASLIIILLALAISSPLAIASPKASKSAANTVAICACGKVFVPDANTLYMTVNGKDYACCTKACHEVASKDVTGSAKMADEMTAKMTSQMNHAKLGVANVIAVTDKGTKALCGCGKRFTIDETTEYLTHDGKSYACCTHECHLMASKDPKAAIKGFEDQMSGM